MSTMFPHGPRQLLVFIIGVMLILKYCSSAPVGVYRHVFFKNEIVVLPIYEAATFLIQKLYMKSVMLCLGIDAPREIKCENWSKHNFEERFHIFLYRLAKPTTLQHIEQEFGRATVLTSAGLLLLQLTKLQRIYAWNDFRSTPGFVVEGFPL